MKITNVRPELPGILDLSFSNGEKGTVDISDIIGKGVFKGLESKDAFGKVSIGSGGELIWENGADLCADALYLRMTGKRPEDIFPALHGASSHA